MITHTHASGGCKNISSELRKVLNISHVRTANLNKIFLKFYKFRNFHIFFLFDLYFENKAV